MEETVPNRDCPIPHTTPLKMTICPSGERNQKSGSAPYSTYLGATRAICQRGRIRENIFCRDRGHADPRAGTGPKQSNVRFCPVLGRSGAFGGLRQSSNIDAQVNSGGSICPM